MLARLFHTTSLKGEIGEMGEISDEYILERFHIIDELREIIQNLKVLNSERMEGQIG